MILLAPVPGGVLTRRDDPSTPADERLHDQNSRDVGVNGNPLGWPVLSLFAGTVITAGTWFGYGLTVRVEGRPLLSKRDILRAQAPWPMEQWMRNQGRNWDQLEDDALILVPMRVLYGHHENLWVRANQTIERFQPIGGMGHSGRSDGNHSHVKARILGLPEPICFVDPLPLFVFA